MTTITTTSELVPGYLDVTRLAVASFLARYREPTLTAYTQDLKAYLGWCQITPSGRRQKCRCLPCLCRDEVRLTATRFWLISQPTSATVVSGLAAPAPRVRQRRDHTSLDETRAAVDILNGVRQNERRLAGLATRGCFCGHLGFGLGTGP